MRHAGLRRDLGEDGEALRLLERAHELDTDGAEFRFARGLERLICGHARDAEVDFETSLRMDPAACAATLELSRLRTLTPGHNHLEEFDHRSSLVTGGTLDHAALEFARYKKLEDLGRYDEAWRALTCANMIMRTMYPHDAERMRRQVDALTAGGEWQISRQQPPVPAGPQPIFILGLPRSGTTLLDRLLGGHS